MSSVHAPVNPYQMEVGGEGGPSGPAEFVRGVDANGEPIVQVMTADEQASFTVPRRGEYRLRIRGFQVPFKQANRYRGQIGLGGKVDDREFVVKTKLDLQIINRETGQEGPHVLIWCSFPNRIADNSNFGKIWYAACGDPEGRSVVSATDMIGKDIVGMIIPSQSVDENGRPRGANLAWDTVAPFVPGGDDSDLWS